MPVKSAKQTEIEKMSAMVHRKFNREESAKRIFAETPFLGMQLTTTELSVVMSVFKRKRASFPRSELQRFVRKGLLRLPYSVTDKVNGMMEVQPTQKLIDEVKAIEVFVDL